MKKKPSQRRQIELIIYAVIVLTALGFIALTIWLRKLVNFPTVLFYVCLPLVVVLMANLTMTILEKTRYKGEIDRMEKEAEEEEENESTGKNEKPRIWSIGLFAALALIWAVIEGVGTSSDMIKAKSFIAYIPDMICALTLLVIGLLLAGITYNVWKGRVFTETNSRLIYLIAVTLTVSVIIQLHYWDSTPMIPNETVGMYFMGFGIMTAFFGSLFNIAIKMKNDQDLTI